MPMLAVAVALLLVACPGALAWHVARRAAPQPRYYDLPVWAWRAVEAVRAWLLRAVRRG
jgi:hypothetical protein